MATNGISLDKIYGYVLDNLTTIDVKSIYPDCKTLNLAKTDSVCDECFYEFVENCIFYYAVLNKQAIDPSGIPDCGAGAF